MLITLDHANNMLARMDRSDTLFVDLEATGLNCKARYDHAVGVAIADQHGQSVYLPYQHEAGAEDNLPIQHLYDVVVPFLNKQRRTLVYAGPKYDKQAWATWGINIDEWSVTHICVQIMMYLLNEEFFSFELDYLGKKLLGVGKESRVPDFADIFGWRAVTPKMMNDYAKSDVAKLTGPLFYLLKPEIEKRGLWDLAILKTKFALHLSGLEMEGVGVNNLFCEEMAERGNIAMKMITQKVGFNPGSPIELGDYLLNYLQLPVLKRGKPNKEYPQGRPSFDKTVMERYMTMLEDVNDDTARLVLDYRGWSKAVSSLYLPMLTRQDSDSRIRTEFRQVRTVTGRLASANPNLQQIPRWTVKPWNGRAKESFLPGRDDYELVGYDYSQLELRLAAAYGNDPILKEIFADPKGDVFQHFAEVLFGEFNDETRYRAKNRFIYPMNYGAGKAKIASALGITIDEVEELYDKYQAEHPGIYTAMKETERRAKSRGYIKYWTGRRRHLRYKDQSYKMWNSLMQGGAAELVERAMMRAPNNKECTQVLQVHDEIVFAIRKDKIAYYDPIIKHTMTDFNFGVPLKVEGKYWTQGEKKLELAA